MLIYPEQIMCPGLVIAGIGIICDFLPRSSFPFRWVSPGYYIWDKTDEQMVSLVCYCLVGQRLWFNCKFCISVWIERADCEPTTITLSCYTKQTDKYETQKTLYIWVMNKNRWPSKRGRLTTIQNFPHTLQQKRGVTFNLLLIHFWYWPFTNLLQ